MTLLGWPAAALAALLMILGLLHERAAFLFGAGIVILPFSLYLAATPRFPWTFALPLATFATALLVRRGAKGWASALVVLVLASLAYLLLSIPA
jgi:hypothetical protein